MATKHIYGLASILMGAIAGDGGMGTSLTQIGETVDGTATLTSEDNTITDFNVEESALPIESITSAYGKWTFSWSSYDVSPRTMYKFFGGILSLFKSILTLGSVTGGTLYTNGTYTNVPLTGGTGSGAKATVVVSGAAVTTVTVTDGGEGYTVSDALSALAANIGGTGSGFTVPVATLSNGSATASTWEAPAQIPDLEQSLKITDKRGNIFEIPRIKVSSKPTYAFSKTALGQLDFVGTVLLPTKANTGPIKYTAAI